MQKDVTGILIEFGNGSKEACDKLFTVVYDELREIAGKQLQYEQRNKTLSRTELVHEVFLKLVDKDQIDWKNRSHFYGVASICMKQLLIDYARKKLTNKRGGNVNKQTYIDELIPAKKIAQQIINLDDALQKLYKINPRMAEVVDYRFFGGMTIEDTAEVMDVSKNTVKRDWSKARGLLYKELQDQLK